jgi:tetratricopeptide (TPR) repeat protein
MARVEFGRLAGRKMSPIGRLILCVVIAATAGVYAQTAAYGFVYDDPRQIEMSASRFTWAQAPGYFTTDVWDYVNGKAGNYYRPVFLLWLLVNYQLFGLSHPFWHLSTAAMHVAATALLFFLARKLTGNDIIAGITALLFGLHPAHVEAVAWVSGVTEPLAAALVFGALLAYLDGRRSLAPALFAAAVFAKETAIVVPALIFALEALFATTAPRQRIRSAVRAVVPYAAVVLVYLGFRFTALHRFEDPSKWRLREVLLTIPGVVCLYLKQLVWPARMALFHDLDPVTRASWMNFGLPLILLAAIAVGAAAVSRRSRATAFACALLAIPLLPVLDLAAFSREDFFHDRYLYVPSAGLCLLAALAMRKIAAERAVWLALPVAAALAWVTVHESRFWSSNSALASRAVEISPDNPTAREFYAADLVLNDRFADALPLLEKNEAAHPDDPDLLYAIGICRYRLDEWQEAADTLRRVLDLRPDYPHARLLLGMADAELGRLDEAESEMRAAVRGRPRVSEQYRGYHAALAALLEKKGYEAELREFPDDSGSFDRAEHLRAQFSHPPPPAPSR